MTLFFISVLSSFLSITDFSDRSTQIAIVNKPSVIISNSNSTSNNICADSLVGKSVVVECHFLTDVNQELAIKIDDFIKKRSGVISSKTDIISKTITVQVDRAIISGDFEVVFNAVKVKFLDVIDRPSHSEN
jgi:hypothetical protein